MTAVICFYKEAVLNSW